MRHEKFPPCCTAGWDHTTEYFVFSTVYLTGGTSFLHWGQLHIIAELAVQVVINHMGAWSVPYIQQLAKDMPELPIVMANDGMEVTV